MTVAMPVNPAAGVNPNRPSPNLNVPFHTVAIDGVYSVAGPEPVFFHLPGPTDEEVEGIVSVVAYAAMQDLTTHGYLSAADKESEASLETSLLNPIFAESEQLAAAVSTSSVMRVAFGDRAGCRVRHIGRGFGWEDEEVVANGRRCFSVNVFTIHANRYIGMKERGPLEKLLAYGAAAPLRTIAWRCMIPTTTRVISSTRRRQSGRTAPKRSGCRQLNS